jgi:hypothetical protein
MPETWYLAIGAGIWGNGTSVEAAKSEMLKAASSRAKGSYKVYQAPAHTEKPYMDNFGFAHAEAVREPEEGANTNFELVEQGEYEKNKKGG